MALKQSRRTVSLNRQVYEDLRDYSHASGEPMSQLVQFAVTALIDSRVCTCKKFKPHAKKKKS